MTQSTRHNDGKLLFAIAGGILVIAAGIAVLANIGDRGETVSQEVTALPAVRTAAVEPAVLPASNTTPYTKGESSLADSIEATAAVETAFVVDPSADFVREGIVAHEAKRYEEAAAYFAAEAQARPDRAWTHYILALSQWKAGNADAAADSMRRSLELDATHVKAFVNLSRIENDRREFDAALAAAEQGLALEPENAAASFLQARSLYNLGDKEAALAALETSLDSDAENGYAHNLVGLIWIERGEGSVAADAMERAVARIPDVAFVHNNLGMALELSGRLDESAAAYSRAVELAPGEARAALNLARLDGRIPESPAQTADEEPVVAALTQTDESEIPD